MIQILVWIIFYLFFMGAVLVVEYWVRLFRERDEYRRDELIDFPNIIRERLLYFSGGKFSGYLAMALGAGTGWFLTLFGGLVSPGSARLPDYATGEITNYFFQSFLFIGILHVTWPSLIEVLRERQISLIDDFMESEVLFFMGLSCALAAMNISIWGVYHDMSFLYCLVNLLICLAYAGYRLQQFEESGPGPADEEY
jgi:hypothetical protein